MVWDLVVRIVHWGMVASIAVPWLVADLDVHEAAGYVLLVLIAFRVAWGFVGPEHARFSDFVRRPHTVFVYAKQTLIGQEPRYIGHNPLGGWMILALLAVGLATSLSGWLYTTETFWGYAWVEAIHNFFATLILVLAAIHVAGVVLVSIKHRENLIASMFHGKKR